MRMAGLRLSRMRLHTRQQPLASRRSSAASVAGQAGPMADGEQLVELDRSAFTVVKHVSALVLPKKQCSKAMGMLARCAQSASSRRGSVDSSC
jgi:hypothetical protein